MEEAFGDDNDLFYENMEAPKFVDLRAPDRHRADSDDRYWFCLRVGCDQKHEEEIDPETIYNNFLLRVMAARSPGVKLRKALHNNDSLKTCPRTVPAKSTTRISKLAIISHNNANKKLKLQKPPLPLSPHDAKKKLKQPKAMTTPIMRPTFNMTTSARAVKVPNSCRVVPKALVFHSPPHKALLKLKKSIELSSSLRKIRSGTEKLEITNGKKDGASSSQLKKDVVSRKQLRGRAVKSRVYSSLLPQKESQRETKPSILSKPKNKDQLTEASASQRNSNEPEDISIKSHPAAGTSENKENKEIPTNLLQGLLKSSTLSELASPLHEEKQTEQLVATASAGELMDDKENASGYDENRTEKSHANRSLKKKVMVEGSRCTQKDSETTSRAVKDPCLNSTQSQGTKYRKPKPTNPRPFRLRTDERQILKEANLEKKHLTETVKKVTRIPENLSRSTQQQQKLKTTSLEFLGHTGTTESDKKATDQPRRAPKSTKVVRPQRVLSGKKKASGQLEAVKENSPASLKPTRATPQHTPKEPKFHSIHTTKSCMRRVEIV